MGAEGIREPPLRHRAARPVPDLRAPEAKAVRLPRPGMPAGADCAHRQLWIPELPDHRALPAPAR